MHYLIDGHNLIAYLPDIDLADPDDEVQLVYKLRSFATRTQRKLTVVFDGGLPGGVSKSLSTSQVKVKFASSGTLTADQIIMKMLGKNMILVSSDREIMQVALKKKIEVLTCPQFIELLTPPKPFQPDDDKEDNPSVSPEEVEHWLRIFSKR